MASPVAAPRAPGAVGDGSGALRALGSSRALRGRREAAWRAAPAALGERSVPGCASGNQGLLVAESFVKAFPGALCWAGNWSASGCVLHA